MGTQITLLLIEKSRKYCIGYFIDSSGVKFSDNSFGRCREEEDGAIDKFGRIIRDGRLGLFFLSGH